MIVEIFYYTSDRIFKYLILFYCLSVGLFVEVQNFDIQIRNLFFILYYSVSNFFENFDVS